MSAYMGHVQLKESAAQNRSGQIETHPRGAAKPTSTNCQPIDMSVTSAYKLLDLTISKKLP